MLSEHDETVRALRWALGWIEDMGVAPVAGSGDPYEVRKWDHARSLRGHDQVREDLELLADALTTEGTR
jgi:hypothetical protein